MPATVHSLAVYPVKSTAGQALQRARVLPRGLENDRRWMLVDAGGSFLTGREHPALVRIRATPTTTGLVLEAPGAEPLTVPDARGAGAAIAVRIWGDRVPARRVDPAADAWFGRLLGRACTLVHMPRDTRRAVDPDFGAPSDEVSFADGYPLLLVGEASLADLSARSSAAVPMARFRPNVTVAGTPAFAEDAWRRIRVGEVEFVAPKPCDRCVMTTLDPVSGERHPRKEPLRTLASYRRDRARGILFGVNLIPRGTGTIAVGDEIRVLD